MLPEVEVPAGEPVSGCAVAGAGVLGVLGVVAAGGDDGAIAGADGAEEGAAVPPAGDAPSSFLPHALKAKVATNAVISSGYFIVRALLLIKNGSSAAIVAGMRALAGPPLEGSHLPEVSKNGKIGL